MSSDGTDAPSWMVRASTAVFGGAVAVGIAPYLQTRAGAGELPGALPLHGLSPSGPILQFAIFVLFVLVSAAGGSLVAPRLAGVRWATVAYCAALLSSPLPLMYFGNVRHVVLHGVVAAAIVVFARRLRPRFSVDDVVLLPLLISCDFAFLDVDFGHTVAATFVRAAIAVFALRLAIGVLSNSPRPALAFALTPLAFAFQIGWLPPALSGALALAWIVITPLICARWLRERIASRALAWIVYPIALSLYPLVLIDVASKPRVNFFEDAHDLLTASEMLRGERPYADILPTHGFLADGGIDWVAMKLGAGNAGEVLATRRVVAIASVAAMYFVTLAASGSSAAGCLAVLLGFALFPGATSWWRVAPALFTIAACAAAVRMRRERWLFPAGAALAVALLTSVDFAVYTAAVVLFVILRWPRPFRAALLIAGGFVAVLVPAVLAFAIAGFAGPFFTGTVEVIRAGRVFVNGPFRVPECLRSISALMWRLPDPRCLSAVLWAIALIVSAAGLARSPLRMRRGDALWIVGVWIAVAGLTWAERQHTYYEFGLAPFVVASLFRFRRHRAAVAAIAVAVILLARPFTHLFDVATPMRRGGGLPAGGWVEVVHPRRAAGALFAPETARGVAVIDSFLQSQMRPGETFFDFANASILYYLFDRDCPIRQVIVPFYETESDQRAVIHAIDANRRIRAALLDFPGSYTDIDGVSNAQRAPLVWQYLQQHFSPAVAQDGVVIWKRRQAYP